MHRKHAWCLLAIALLVPLVTAAKDEPEVDRVEARRAAIVEMAVGAIEQLIADDERAAETFASSVGYAVFDNFKFTFLLSGGGGVGVAVDRASGERTYMKMGSGGVGLGLGGQSYQVVFMFESAEAFDRFVNKGWQADLSANAAAGTAGKNVPSTFRDGVAVYQITHKGLVAQADISGTRFWRSKKLNP
jgi:lipid-binding SYLF domain-containing protein